MKLSTRSIYGVKAMVELASAPSDVPVPLSVISSRQGISQPYLEQILALLKKASLIEGRLSTIISRAGFSCFGDYIAFVKNDKTGRQASLLVSKLTTNYTYFMRERQHYDFLRDVALPELKPRIVDNDLRIWSAGCSSGEEAYTAAMVVDQYLSIEKPYWDSTKLATDISENVLAQAQRATYPIQRMGELPEEWKRLYFDDIGQGQYQITSKLRNEVLFAKFNLMDSFSRFSKKFHIIFCRNVMIYFNGETRAGLVEKFYDALAPGGYLFIGLSEVLTNADTDFTYIMPAVYKKV